MSKSSIKVIFKPGGYEAYKDQVPIRKPQWKIILIMVAGIFGFGVICSTVSLLLLSQFWGKSTPPAVVELATEESTFQARISDAMPTNTPTTELTNTPISETTATPDLQATLAHLDNRLSAMQTQTATPITATQLASQRQPTVEPTSTAIPSIGIATVVRCNATIRVAPGTQYGALGAVCGMTYPILALENGWVQVYLGYSSGWIRSDLLKLEMNQ
jgi:hypothetical protein